MSFTSLAQQLKDGTISISEWHAQMRDFIRLELIAAMDVAKGGREFITPADWGFVGSQAKIQYDYLDRFAADIQKDPAAWLTGRLNTRMDLYNKLGYSALEEDLKRESKKAGFTEERRVLGDADHCKPTSGRPGCVELARKSWQPIGTLPKIGETACYTHCLCEFEYRKPDGAGGWIYGDE